MERLGQYSSYSKTLLMGSMQNLQAGFVLSTSEFHVNFNALTKVTIKEEKPAAHLSVSPVAGLTQLAIPGGCDR